MKKITPYKWQLKAAALGAARKIFAIAADCGCGKTLAAILIAIKKQMPVIIIAPTHRLCEQWKNDLKDVMGDEADVWVYKKPEETRRGGVYREEFEKWLTA